MMFRVDFRLLSRLRSTILGPVLALCLLALAAPAAADFGDCGQPVTNGPSPLASDALFTLGAAVGTQSCELCVCDLNNDGLIAATDALIDLAAAVGQQVSLNCPACQGQMNCFESEAPSCGGSCEEGRTCAPDPEAPDECSCLNACQIGPAPTCGGSCESEDPGAVCTSVRIDPAGLDPIELCECLPPGVSFCENAQAPDCEGICSSGTLCESDGGSGCVCSVLPVQPACSQASFPSCSGTCPNSPQGGGVCESDGVDACVCVPFNGQNETCFDADEPMCGGSCAFGDICAFDLDGCDCVAPCDLNQAPSCGGDCSDADETCVVTSISANGQTKDFCECWVLE